MYHLSTDTTGKWNIVGDYKNILKPSGFVLPFNYRTEVPFELFLCTSLPDNPDARLIIMQSSPSSSLYTSFSNAEIAPYIDNGKLHQHDFFELMFVIEGTVYQNIEYERHVYPAGSCCLINTNTQHIEEYHNASRILFLQLSKNFARNLFTAEQYFPTEDALCNGLMKNFFLQTLHQKNPAQKEYIDFIPLRDASWVKQYIHSIFEKMFHEIQEPVFGSSFRLCALCMELFWHLFDQNNYYNTPVKPGTEPERILFEQLSQFMKKTGRKVSRRQLEANFNYSGDYLYKIIRKYTGLGIHEYSSSLCMTRAAQLLLSSKMNINEIAELLGFCNYTQFYKAFEEYYHMTPKTYRKTMH